MSRSPYEEISADLYHPVLEKICEEDSCEAGYVEEEIVEEGFYGDFDFYPVVSSCRPSL